MFAGSEEDDFGWRNYKYFYVRGCGKGGLRSGHSSITNFEQGVDAYPCIAQIVKQLQETVRFYALKRSEA